MSKDDEKVGYKKDNTKGKKVTSLTHTVRDGAITAHVWRRQSPSGARYLEFSVSRRAKNVLSGESGYRMNFFVRHRDQLLKVVCEVCDWISENEKECTSKKAAA